MDEDIVWVCPFCKHEYELWPLSLANGGAVATYCCDAIECSCGAVIAKASAGRPRKDKDLKESG